MAIGLNSKLTALNNVINSVNMNNKVKTDNTFKMDLESDKKVDTCNIDTADEKIKARTERINKIEEYYKEDTNPDEVPQLDTKIMLKVAYLRVEDNEKYYDNGKVSINKVAKDCGVSLDDISPQELNSIRKELDEEGLLDKRTNEDLKDFIHRSYFDNMLTMAGQNNYSIEDLRLDSSNLYAGKIYKDAYTQKMNCFDKCKHFIDIDNKFGQFLSQRVMENVFDIFNN